MKYLLLSGVIFSFKFSLAQVQTDTVVRNWFAFAQKTDMSPYAGKKIILKAAVRIIKTDSVADCAIWARVDLKNGELGFFDNMDNRPIQSPDWKYYTISGVVDSLADKLVFGGLCSNNGQFYYDDFSLLIQNNVKGWDTIKIPNSGFEKELANNWQPGTGRRRRVVKGFSMQTSNTKPFRGSKSLLVKGMGVINYGQNNSAGRFYKINGANIYCETYGMGEPLLLLHGNGQSIDAFTAQIPFFEKKYRLIIPDCRGRGRSTDTDDELTYHGQADDMRQLLDSLHTDSANIIGWSDGGVIGLIMAMNYPGKVKNLIASGANIQQDSSVFGKEDYERMKVKSTDTSISKMRRKLYKLMVYYPNIAFSELSKINCPVLFTAGDKDEISFGHTVKMFESVMHGQLFIVPGTSHYVLSENPDVFNAAALKFLEKK
jgi:pimeloyl-ACP methyl ester carboxylesterase